MERARVKVKRQLNFVKGISGAYFIQTPTSVGAGLARQQWFIKHFRRGATIVSEDVWEIFSNKYKQKTLVEYDDGKFEVKDIA